jgi:hypothetical protein
MNETLDEAIDVLDRLQFETGGRLLDHVVALRNELGDERRRRIDQLQKAGVPDAQLGTLAVAHDPPPDDEAEPGEESWARAWLRSYSSR